MSLELLSAIWDLDLERNEKDVLEVLAWHANADGICWPSKARIMYTKSLSESTVKRTLASLKKQGLLSVEAYAEGGRGKTPLYKLHPEKGVRKLPFNEWKEGIKGVTADNKRGSGETLKGVTAMTPEPSIEPSVEPSSSRRDAQQADASPEEEKTNPFTVFCNRMKEMDLSVSPEDRRRVPGNLKVVQRDHEATDEQMMRVILFMTEARLRDFPMSPQEAWNKTIGKASHKHLAAVAAEKPDPGANSEAAAARRQEGYEWLLG